MTSPYFRQVGEPAQTSMKTESSHSRKNNELSVVTEVDIAAPKTAGALSFEDVEFKSKSAEEDKISLTSSASKNLETSFHIEREKDANNYEKSRKLSKASNKINPEKTNKEDEQNDKYAGKYVQQ